MSWLVAFGVFFSGVVSGLIVGLLAYERLLLPEAARRLAANHLRVWCRQMEGSGDGFVNVATFRRLALETLGRWEGKKK